MKLKTQVRLAKQVASRVKRNISFNPERMEEIKEAITKADIRGLIKDGAIVTKAIKGKSRSRARKLKIQKTKGRIVGRGSRKGKASTRRDPKESWMARIRKQRALLLRLKKKSKISPKNYLMLYRRCKGGYFRNLRHLKLYIEEQYLMIKGES